LSISVASSQWLVPPLLEPSFGRPRSRPSHPFLQPFDAYPTVSCPSFPSRTTPPPNPSHYPYQPYHSEGTDNRHQHTQKRHGADRTPQLIPSQLPSLVPQWAYIGLVDWCEEGPCRRIGDTSRRLFWSAVVLGDLGETDLQLGTSYNGTLRADKSSSPGGASNVGGGSQGRVRDREELKRCWRLGVLARVVQESWRRCRGWIC